MKNSDKKSPDLEVTVCKGREVNISAGAAYDRQS